MSFFIVMLLGVALAQDSVLLDPSVFSFEFYLNTNPDICAGAGLCTLQQAQQHWLTYGIVEGRQASGAFHSQQYFERYPNLAQQFNNNFTLGIENYVTEGKQQGLIGIVDGGAFNRWTMYNATEGIFVSASNRTAGAIDSFVWNNVEFLNQWDHGRELQLAVTNGSGECYNPTEAGSSDDSNGYATTSVLKSMIVNSTTLLSSVEPAFWLAPGQPEPNPGPTCHVGINTGLLSDFTMDKLLNLGLPGLPRVLHYTASVFIPSDQNLIQIEGPTAYMPGNFSTFYSIDVNNGSLTLIPHSTAVGTMGTTNAPLVFATSDGQYAMCSYPVRSPVYYGWFDFELIPPATDSTTKWTMVYITNNVTAGSWLEYDTYIVVGTLQQVQNDVVTLTSIMQASA